MLGYVVILHLDSNLHAQGLKKKLDDRSQKLNLDLTNRNITSHR